MALFTRSRTAPARREPTLAAAPVERRDAGTFSGDGWGAMSGLGFGGRGSVNSTAAEGLAAVTAAVDAIASGIASLPVACYRTAGAGRVEAPEHPVATLLRAPNPLQTWPGWVESMLSSVLLHGNAVSVIERDGAGRPVALRFVPWQCISLQVLPGGRIVFDVLSTMLYGGPSLVGRYFDSELLWLRDRSDTGVVGRSRLSRAPAVIQAALGLAEFSESVWRNSSRPSGMLTMPAGVSPDAVKRIRSNWEANQEGRHNAGKVVYAEAGQAFTPISSNPIESEVLESRRFGVIEVCRLFNVPPPILQAYENSTFTNASQASTWFASNTLTPWARRLEAEFSRSVFTDPAYHIEIDLAGLLRGDFASRWTANVAAVTAGILRPDEVHAQEGYGPLPALAVTAPTPPVIGPPGT